MQVIGLSGPEGAGKSTVANLLHNYGFGIVPFAKPLKDMLRALGVPEPCLTGTPEQKLSPLEMFGGKSARDAMKTLGTEWGRNCIAPDFWSKAWLHHVKGLRHARNEWSIGSENIVADDVRFPQEVAAIKSLGGRVICVVRSMADFERRPTHPSENFAALIPDCFIVNDGTIDDLRAKISKALEPIPPPLRQIKDTIFGPKEMPSLPYVI